MLLLFDVGIILLMVACVAGFSQIARLGTTSNSWHPNKLRTPLHHGPHHYMKQMMHTRMTTTSENNYFFPWDTEEGLEGQLGDSNDDVGIYHKKKVLPSRTFLQRIDNHDIIHVTEIEQLFTPTKLDRDHIIGSTLSRGFVGFILSLEGALLDVTKLYEECYFTFIEQTMHKHKRNDLLPSKEAIRDIIGLPFRDACVELQIGIPKHVMVEAEIEFYALMDRILDNYFDNAPDSIRPQKGAFSFIEHLLNDHNDLVIQTNLPREIAQRLLGHTGLADLLADYDVSIDHFVPYPFTYQLNDDQRDFSDEEDDNEDRKSLLNHSKRPHHPHSETDDDYDEMLQNFYAPMHGDRFQMNQYLRCCAKMQSIPSMTMLLDSNRKNIITAKRVGIPCVGVKGHELSSQFLRGADLIIEDLSRLNMHRSYQLIKHAMKASVGPSTQFEAPPMRVRKSHRYELEVLDPDDKEEHEGELLPERPELYRKSPSFFTPPTKKNLGDMNSDGQESERRKTNV